MSLGRTVTRTSKPSPRCPCRCGTSPGFCADHKARLAAIREELGEERFGRSLKAARDRSPGVPMCCNPHCWNPREPGMAFCWEHEGEGDDDD